MAERSVVVVAFVMATVVVSHAAAGCDRSKSEHGASASPEGAASSELAGASRTGSCDRITAMSVCSEYSGAYFSQNEPFLSAGCTKLAGTFARADCPNTAVLGSCTLSTTEIRRFYASGAAAYDAARAEKECTGPYRGKWTPFR